MFMRCCPRCCPRLPGTGRADVRILQEAEHSALLNSRAGTPIIHKRGGSREIVARRRRVGPIRLPVVRSRQRARCCGDGMDSGELGVFGPVVRSASGADGVDLGACPSKGRRDFCLGDRLGGHRRRLASNDRRLDAQRHAELGSRAADSTSRKLTRNRQTAKMARRMQPDTVRPSAPSAAVGIRAASPAGRSASTSPAARRFLPGVRPQRIRGALKPIFQAPLLEEVSSSAHPVSVGRRRGIGRLRWSLARGSRTGRGS